MTRQKLAVVLALVALGAFLAGFVATLAPGLGDEDHVAMTELTLAAPLEASASPPPPAPRHPSVDRDCYEEGSICAKGRVGDVVAIADAVTGILSEAGWPVGCFEVRIIGGDDGERDAVSIGVQGRAKLGPPRCQEAGAGGATRSQLTRVARRVQETLRGAASIANVDLVQVTDGLDVSIELEIP